MKRTSKNSQLVLSAFNKGYRVSNEGDVFAPSGTKLKLSLNRKGYYMFCARLDGAGRRLFVHHLLAYQKFGEEIFQTDCIRHLDDVSTNNSFDNIGIGSRSDNAMDMSKKKRVMRSVNSNKRFSDEDVLKMRELKNNGHTYLEIMEMYGITSKGTMSHIINKRIV